MPKRRFVKPLKLNSPPVLTLPMTAGIYDRNDCQILVGRFRDDNVYMYIQCGPMSTVYFHPRFRFSNSGGINNDGMAFTR